MVCFLSEPIQFWCILHSISVNSLSNCLFTVQIYCTLYKRVISVYAKWVGEKSCRTYVVPFSPLCRSEIYFCSVLKGEYKSARFLQITFCVAGTWGVIYWKSRAIYLNSFCIPDSVKESSVGRWLWVCFWGRISSAKLNWKPDLVISQVSKFVQNSFGLFPLI